jgi:SNF2 family DNA or RNA helicase
VETKHVISQIISLQYICGGLSVEKDHAMISTGKLEELFCLLKNELHGQKVLVWCRFRAEQTAICSFLTARRVPNHFINGDTSDRKDIRRMFFLPQSSKSVEVLVMTISAGAKGGDWSAADTSIYYSNFWNNDMRSQSEDRIFHPEKTTPSLIIDLCYEDSIDEDVLTMLREKKFSSEALLGRLECQIKMRSKA